MADRSERAYVVNPDKLEGLRAHLSEGFLRPSLEAIDSVQAKTKQILQTGEVRVLIPMQEQGPVLTPALSLLTNLMPPHYITIVDDGSDDLALETAYRFGATVVEAQRILDAVNWNKILPILNLTERPHGKGVAVFAGSLHQYYAAKLNGQTPSWLCHHDSEIEQYDAYRGLEYLMYGLLQYPDRPYIKMAKTGRGNGRIMTVRNTLQALSNIPSLPENVRRRAYDLYLHTTPHKWMLTGEFLLHWDIAMKRFFGTGYLEETLITLFAPRPIQVSNPNPRRDAKNSPKKEATMQQEIGNALIYAAFEKPLEQWDIADIRRINSTVLDQNVEGARIPDPEDSDPEGPNEPFTAKSNRVIPSIEMLRKEGLINESELLDYIESHR